MKRVAPWALPALAGLVLLVAGPQRATFDTVQLPKLAGLLALAALVVIRGRPRPVDAVDLMLSALFGLAVLSAVFSYSWGAAVRPLATLLGGLVLFGALRAETERQRWLAALVVAATVASLLGLGEVAGLWRGSWHGRAPSSVFGQRNALAQVLVLVLPAAWALAATASGLRARVGWLSCAMVLTAGVGVTRSRGAWLALAACLAVALVAAFVSRRQADALGPAVTLAAFALTLVLPGAEGWVADHPYRDSFARLIDTSSGSGAGRLLQWRHALELFAQSPVLGVGPGNWRVALPLVVPEATAHGHFINSDWVALLTERGAVGALALIVASGLSVRRWAMIERTALGLPLVLLVLVAAAVTGAFDSVTQLAPATLILAIVCGVGLRPSEGRHEVPARFLCATAVVLAGLALGTVSSLASRLISSSDDIGFDRLELAVVLDPLDGDLRLTLAEAYVSAGRCAEASKHLEMLNHLLPFDQHGAGLRRACDRRPSSAR